MKCFNSTMVVSYMPSKKNSTNDTCFVVWARVSTLRPFIFLLTRSTSLPRSLCHNNITTCHFCPIRDQEWCSATDVSQSVSQYWGEQHYFSFLKPHSDLFCGTNRFYQLREPWRSPVDTIFLLFLSDFAPFLQTRYGFFSLCHGPGAAPAQHNKEVKSVEADTSHIGEISKTSYHQTN